MVMPEILQLEHGGWRALVEGRGREFYAEWMDPEVRVIVPGAVLGKEATLASWPDGPAWDEFVIEEPELYTPVPDLALLVYRAVARRGDLRYVAHITSGYARRDGGWRMVLHQQTPSAE